MESSRRGIQQHRDSVGKERSHPTYSLEWACYHSKEQQQPTTKREVRFDAAHPFRCGLDSDRERPRATSIGKLIEFCDPSLGFTVAVFDGPQLERTLTFCQQAKNDCLERLYPEA